MSQSVDLNVDPGNMLTNVFLPCYSACLTCFERKLCLAFAVLGGSDRRSKSGSATFAGTFAAELSDSTGDKGSWNSSFSIHGT